MYQPKKKLGILL